MLKNRWYLFIPLLLFFGLCIFLWRGLYLDPQELPSAFIGKPLPHFVLPDLLHPSQTLSDKNFYGHVSLLNVWATWCINCQIEHPVLIDITRDADISVYGLDYKDDRAQALAWLQQYGNPYQVVGFDQTGTVAINLGVYGTPETFLIDKQGVVRYKYIGPLTQEVWQEILLPKVREWLAKP